MLRDEAKTEPTKPDMDALKECNPQQLLHMATLIDDVHMVRSLLEAGVDIDHQTCFEEEALDDGMLCIRFEGLFDDVHQLSTKERQAAREAKGGAVRKKSQFATRQLRKAKRSFSIEVLRLSACLIIVDRYLNIYTYPFCFYFLGFNRGGRSRPSK
jgi:hypothetical protein